MWCTAVTFTLGSAWITWCAVTGAHAHWGQWVWTLLIGLLFASGAADCIRELRASWRGRRTQARFRTAHCVRCGYDLRGSPSVRCPECGTWHGRRLSRTS